MQSLIFIEVNIIENKLITPNYLFHSMNGWIDLGNFLERPFYT